MLPPRSIVSRLASFALLAGLFVAPGSALADFTQGTSCTVKAAAGIGNSAVTDGNNLVCVSGTWQYPTYVLQSVASAAGASCSTYPAGAMRYNTTLTNVEMCDGTNWRFLAASTTACGTPSGLTFTNLSSQTLGISVASNTTTITFSGCSSGQSVSVSGAATAQISINGGTWGTSGSITSGQTLNVRMTTSNSVSTTLTATVTVGSTSANWTTTTRSGSLLVFMTANQYTAPLGGLSGADAVCQSEAGTAGYAGTYKAILSDATTSAASRLTLSYPIINAHDATTVSASNLWSGTLATAIENPSGGVGTSGGDPVWSGTTVNGSISSGNTCSSWSSASGTGHVGVDQQGVGALWIDWQNNSCSSTSYLYCIQQ